MAFSTGSVTTLAGFITAIGDFAIAQAGFTRTIYTGITFSQGSVFEFADNSSWNSTTEPSGAPNPTIFTITVLSKAGSDVHWVFINDDSEQMQTTSGGASTGAGDYFFLCFLSYSNTGISSSSIYTGTAQVRSNMGGGPSDASLFTIFKSQITNSNYWLYTNGTEVHSVLEIKNNLFNHLSLGQIQKYGSFNGGQYFMPGGCIDRQFSTNNHRYENSGSTNAYPFQEFGNSSPRNYLYNNVGGGNTSNQFAAIGNNNIINNQQCFMAFDTIDINVVPAQGDFNGFLTELLLFANNTFNLRTPLLPIYVRLRNTTSTSTGTTSRDNVFNIVGQFENVRMVNITNLTPKTLVDTDWRVFPLVQKAGGDDTQGPITNYFGLAYKEV